MVRKIYNTKGDSMKRLLVCLAVLSVLACSGNPNKNKEAPKEKPPVVFTGLYS